MVRYININNPIVGKFKLPWWQKFSSNVEKREHLLQPHRGGKIQASNVEASRPIADTGKYGANEPVK